MIFFYFAMIYINFHHNLRYHFVRLTNNKRLLLPVQAKPNELANTTMVKLKVLQMPELALSVYELQYNLKVSKDFCIPWGKSINL